MDLKHRLFSGILWLSSGKFLNFVVSFVGGVFLARLLEPEMFGVVALATAVASITVRLTSVGIGVELLRVDDTREDYIVWMNTFFWVNFCLACFGFLLGLGFLTLTDFFDEGVRAIFLIVLFSACAGNVFFPIRKLLYKRMQHKAISYLEWLPQLITMMVAVAMAYSGFEVWSLVIPQTLSSLIAGLWAFYLLKFPFGFKCTMGAVRQIRQKAAWYFSFALSEDGFDRGDDLIIGKLIGDAALGFYRRAYGLGLLFHRLFGEMIYNLGYPLHANPNLANNSKLAYLRITIKGFVYIMFSTTLFLSYYIHDIVEFLYGEKWLPTADLFLYLVPFTLIAPLYHNLKGYVFGQGGITFSTIIDALKLVIMLIVAFTTYETYGVPGVIAGVNLAVLFAFLANMVFVYRQHLSQLSHFLLPLAYVILASSFFVADMALFPVYLCLTGLVFAAFERKELVMVYGLAKGRLRKSQKPEPVPEKPMPKKPMSEQDLL